MPEDVLSQDEIDALFAGVDPKVESSQVAAPAGARAASPDAPTPIAVLCRLQQDFASRASEQVFAGLLGAPQIELETLKLERFASYGLSLMVPSSLSVIQVANGFNPALLVIDSAMVMNLADLGTGGEGRVAKVDGRDFTDTERDLIEKLVEGLCTCLAEAWQPAASFDAHCARHEVDPAALDVAETDELVLVSRFAVQAAALRGEFHLVMPWRLLARVRDSLRELARRA